MILLSNYNIMMNTVLTDSNDSSSSEHERLFGEEQLSNLTRLSNCTSVLSNGHYNMNDCITPNLNGSECKNDLKRKCDVISDTTNHVPLKKVPPPNGKKTKGRVKIKMEFIESKLRRYTTFSKRKTGIMKKVRLPDVSPIHKKQVLRFIELCRV